VRLLLALSLALTACTSPRRLHVVQLPAGRMDLRSELTVPANTEVRGAPSGTILHMSSEFRGRAAIVIQGDYVLLHGFEIDGNRDALEVRSGLPPPSQSFAAFTANNGILAEGRGGVAIEDLAFRHISGFAILASRSRNVSIERVRVADSGSRNPAGRNNSTGGVLLEEGTTDFLVANCDFRGIRGNALWTHSLYTSARNARGVFARNRFENIGRDAIQAGHVAGLRVEYNTGSRIGFPVDDVDIEGRAIPVAIDTAGDVDASSYTGNSFVEIDGKCIDLDGFHDGEVRRNRCVNRQPPEHYPYGNYGIVMNNSNLDMQSRNIRIVENTIDSPLFGGIFVIGTGHLIARNRLLNLNTAHCNDNAARFGCYYAASDPNILEAGIYLGRGAERPAPARGNAVEDNEITGYRMASRCIEFAPGIDPTWNTIGPNRCR
jgi:hypothetical protein